MRLDKYFKLDNFKSQEGPMQRGLCHQGTHQNFAKKHETTT